MNPPYTLTEIILKLTALISEKIGEIKAAQLSKPPAELRKRNRIKTIQSSLEIEGNPLSIDQITAMLDNKRIVAPEKDIIEVKNAIIVYSRLNLFNPSSLKSLCDAHGMLMDGLLKSPGALRGRFVGITKGSKITHLAPPAERVKPLIKNLFKFLKSDPALDLIKSCVFHYELEFIHPFIDGNGRMGRLWQTLILKRYNPIFEYLPIESLIKERQTEYYSALNKSDKSGSSTQFIEFMMQVINDSLENMLKMQNITLSGKDRIILYRDVIKNNAFTRQDYLRYFKKISPPTASRDLKLGVDKKLLIKSGDKRTTKYRFV